jgi:hypothetical protein
MKTLLYLTLLFTFISCNDFLLNQDQSSEDSLIEVYSQDLYDSYLEFKEDAREYNKQVSNDVKFYIKDQKNTVTCSDQNIVISSEKWNKINDRFYKQNKSHYYKMVVKSLVYKGGALCALGQSSREGFNKFTKIVPVPSSLTYKYGVAVSWLVNVCYNQDGFSLYETLDDCDSYYQKSFWNAYVKELFTLDDTYVLNEANNLEYNI